MSSNASGVGASLKKMTVSKQSGWSVQIPPVTQDPPSPSVSGRSTTSSSIMTSPFGLSSPCHEDVTSQQPSDTISQQSAPAVPQLSSTVAPSGISSPPTKQANPQIDHGKFDKEGFVAPLTLNDVSKLTGDSKEYIDLATINKLNRHNLSLLNSCDIQKCMSQTTSQKLQELQLRLLKSPHQESTQESELNLDATKSQATNMPLSKTEGQKFENVSNFTNGVAGTTEQSTSKNDAAALESRVDPNFKNVCSKILHTYVLKSYILDENNSPLNTPSHTWEVTVEKIYEDPEIAVISKLITPSECDAFLSYFISNRQVWTEGSDKYPLHQVLNYSSLSESLRTVINRIAAIQHMPVDGVSLRMEKLDINQTFRERMLDFWPNGANEESDTSFQTTDVIVFINDVEDQSLMDFIHLGFSAQPVKGTALTWCSYTHSDLTHGGHPMDKRLTWTDLPPTLSPRFTLFCRLFEKKE